MVGSRGGAPSGFEGPLAGTVGLMLLSVPNSEFEAAPSGGACPDRNRAREGFAETTIEQAGAYPGAMREQAGRLRQEFLSGRPLV